MLACVVQINMGTEYMPGSSGKAGPGSRQLTAARNNSALVSISTPRASSPALHEALAKFTLIFAIRGCSGDNEVAVGQFTAGEASTDRFHFPP
ncbi:MAG: hypothetical protein IMF08_15450 [Proteobacteria bacterium]|nr:hypothetical protein [Pseudomonadota bacterium]